ncbi:hypothetical protein [Corynebacterium pyruviciproducens]|uniref:hypothetical protein n=1 Tax=Corynebacterium pyruviciproducens TaxID=598660 RepID=UPI0023F1C10A|nr:hypothetical protein [Corynebacterium pyruviciproducens]
MTLTRDEVTDELVANAAQTVGFFRLLESDADIVEKLRGAYEFAEEAGLRLRRLGGVPEAETVANQLQEELLDLKEQLAQAHSDIADGDEDVKRLESELDQAGAAVNDAERKLLAEHTKSQRLQAEIETSQREFDRLAMEKDAALVDAQETVGKLTKELEETQARLAEGTPTGLLTAHKRLVEGLRKLTDADYEAAIKKFVVAEKTLAKVDGRKFDYDAD